MTSEELKRLEDRRDALKVSVTSLGNWLIGFIVAVVVGLGIELYLPVKSLINKFDWGIVADLIGTALVTLGVMGELSVEWKTHRNEKELLRIDAGIESDNKDRIAALNLMAEQERNARVKLQSEMAGRYISTEQALLLKEKLKPWQGITLLIVQGIETVEAWRFTNRLDEVMGARCCRWDAFINRDKPLPTLPIEGLHILWTPQERSEQAARALIFAMNEIDIRWAAFNGVTHADGIDRSSAFQERLWPPGAWHPEKEAVLLIVNDKPLPERPNL